MAKHKVPQHKKRLFASRMGSDGKIISYFQRFLVGSNKLPQEQNVAEMQDATQDLKGKRSKPTEAELRPKTTSTQSSTTTPTGTLEFEPRMKDDGEGGEIDIANTDYENLPPKWQAENKAAAESAVESVLIASSKAGIIILGTKPDPKSYYSLIEEASDRIHQEWLQRNGEWATEEQKLPYAELSEEEKEKDRVLARKALELFYLAPALAKANSERQEQTISDQTEYLASDLHDEWRESRRIHPRPKKTNKEIVEMEKQLQKKREESAKLKRINDGKRKWEDINKGFPSYGQNMAFVYKGNIKGRRYQKFLADGEKQRQLNREIQILEKQIKIEKN